MQISERLKTIAGCVTKGNIVADIGCDHCLTSIYMIKTNIASRVYAMDINEGPLKIAAANIEKYGLNERIELRISDGIKALKASDLVQTILISGMGGQLVIDILKELDNKACVKENITQLVLSPQSDLHNVREYLCISGYQINDEIMLTDGGKYYIVICAGPGVPAEYQYYEYKYGRVLIEKRDMVLYEYLKKELAKKRKILSGIMRTTGDNERLNNTVCDLRTDILNITNILEKYE